MLAWRSRRCKVKTRSTVFKTFKSTNFQFMKNIQNLVIFLLGSKEQCTETGNTLRARAQIAKVYIAESG